VSVRLNPFDAFAWFILRIFGLVQAKICEMLMPHTTGLKDQIDMMGHIAGGYYLFGAKHPNDLPGRVGEKLMGQGRMIAFVVLAAVFMWLTDDIRKMVMR